MTGSSPVILSAYEKGHFHAAFPRHGIAQTSLTLLIWLTEKVCFRAAISCLLQQLSPLSYDSCHT